jgi:hypothetical protein
VFGKLSSHGKNSRTGHPPQAAARRPSGGGALQTVEQAARLGLTHRVSPTLHRNDEFPPNGVSALWRLLARDRRPDDLEPTSGPSTINGARLTSRLAAPVLLTAAIGSLLLAVPGLRGVAGQIARPRPPWVLAAVGLELASCLAFVVIFRLSFDRVPAGAAREVAWTEQASGALLPGGGVGALAIGGWLLRRVGMSTRSIIDRSSALFFLTSAVNVVALAGAGGLLATSGATDPPDMVRAGIPILGGLAAAADQCSPRTGGSSAPPAISASTSPHSAPPSPRPAIRSPSRRWSSAT